jgi:hypothetical protein
MCPMREFHAGCVKILRVTPVLLWQKFSFRGSYTKNPFGTGSAKKISE